MCIRDRVYVAINTITAVVMPWQDMINANYDWPTGEASEMIICLLYTS